MTELSVRECLSAGWSGFKARRWLFIGVGFILLGASIISDLPRTLAEHAWPEGTTGPLVLAIGFIAFLISTGLSFIISLGKTAFFLRAHDDPKAVGLSDLWHLHPFWKFAAVSVLTGAAAIIGFILLIVPGIIVSIAFIFSQYIAIENEGTPLDAMRESAALTKGNRWNLFWLGLALIGINILGLCALVVGLLVTLPVSSLAIVHAYRVLSKSTDSPAVPVEEVLAA